ADYRKALTLQSDNVQARDGIKQVESAIASIRAAPAPKTETSNEPLPPNIPIDPDVFQNIQRHFSVNPTRTDTAAYEAVMATKSMGQQSTSKQKMTLRVLRPGIIEERTVSEMSITVNGQSFPQKIQTIAYSAGNGLIGLGSRTTAQSRFGDSTT